MVVGEEKKIYRQIIVAGKRRSDSIEVTFYLKWLDIFLLEG